MELIDDALGGFSISNCCVETFQPSPVEKNKTSDLLDSQTSSSSGERDTTTPSRKYAFDVVDDSSDNRIEIDDDEKSTLKSSDDEEIMHKRIVRVSLQKSTRSQGACFKGNESYALYDFGRIFKSTERLQNIVNIRFKTASKNGLMFLISQKHSNQPENYFSLSIEDG